MSKLSDLLDASWRDQSTQACAVFVPVKGERLMMIIPPDGKHDEPMLKIEHQDEGGQTLYSCTMNLPAVDLEIGKLIKMRDLMADMKPSEGKGE